MMMICSIVIIYICSLDTYTVASYGLENHQHLAVVKNLKEFLTVFFDYLPFFLNYVT